VFWGAGWPDRDNQRKYGTNLFKRFPNCHNAVEKSEIAGLGDCYYLIDKNWQGSVKRIYPGEISDQIQLVSDNPDRMKYPSFQREWDQIETICKVKAEVKRH
jgi:hypothetical protein